MGLVAVGSDCLDFVVVVGFAMRLAVPGVVPSFLVLAILGWSMLVDVLVWRVRRVILGGS